MEEKVICWEREQTKFLVDEKWYTIQIDDRSICMKPFYTKGNLKRKKLTLDKIIQLSNVVSTSFHRDSWHSSLKDHSMCSNGCLTFLRSGTSECFSFIINFWVKRKNNLRKLKTVKLQTYNESDCVSWHKLIEHELETTLKEQGYVRPRNVLIFVNPYGGKKQAKQVYKKIVKPLLMLARVKETTVFTEYAGHAHEFIETNELSSYDGIITVSGDGTFSEVANAVLVKEQNKHAITFDNVGASLNKPVNFIRPKVRIGMIPAGSANFTNFVSQGSADPETAMLHVICGESHPLDISSVYDTEGKFMKFAVQAVFCGFMQKIGQIAENYRRFGPIRYEIAMLSAFLEHKTYEPCKISYLLSCAEDPIDLKKETSRCRYPCPVCLEKPPCSTSFGTRTICQESKSTGSTASSCAANQSILAENIALSEVDNKDISSTKLLPSLSSKTDNSINDRSSQIASVSMEEWEDYEISQGFHIVTIFSNAMIYDKSPEGFSPSAHLADGTADLLIVNSTTRRELLKFLRFMRGTANHFDLPCISSHRVKGFRFQYLPENDFTPRKYKDSISTDLAGSQQNSTDSNKCSVRFSSQRTWFCDGDELTSPVGSVWVHRGLINIFSKGIEK